ncbi:MAG: tripartite tricarboxylate transporter substrate binding protein [Burkholderiales bacterium]|nr:tripartite tricarboxylate transporter substrate binding protein [Burkholderiales bacterium]
MTGTRRQFIQGASAALAASLASPWVHASDAYPIRPIRIVSPYQAGGIVDILSRLLGDKLQRSLGQPVIVEAKAGAGGNVGTAYVARTARGDPYTLLMGASGPLAANVTLFRNLGYDPLKDLVPITLVAATPLVLCVSAASKPATFAELAAQLKAAGDKASFATAGAGTPQHLGVELLKQQLGLESTHVPYKGAAPAVNALLADEVTFSIDHFVLVLPHVRAGKLRPLAVTSPQRVAELPDVPTLQELGINRFEVRGWYGLLAPADVPESIVRRLNVESVNGLRQPDAVARLASFGSPSVAGSPEEFRSLITAEIAKWRVVITKGGITAA